MWEAFAIDDDLPHVVPMNDLRPHDLERSCWCKPFDGGGVLVHNSLDGREHYERGELLKH